MTGDWRKISLFIVLMISTSLFPNFGRGLWWTGVDVGINHGFPLSFYGYGGGPPQEPEQPAPRYYYPLSLMGDMVLWFLVSHASVAIFDRLNTRRPSRPKHDYALSAQ